MKSENTGINKWKPIKKKGKGLCGMMCRIKKFITKGNVKVNILEIKRKEKVNV